MYKRVFDFVLDTIPYQHDLDRFIPLLKRDATLCRVGVGKLTTPNEYGQMTTVLTRTALAGSNTGGIRETQDMLEFCAAQKIKPQITADTDGRHQRRLVQGGCETGKIPFRYGYEYEG